ncbi:MAG: Glu/Leu/Phe/Val dehydrogenase [Deltaproteobacteria bacterium]|jgi:glutamate dehydrogenase/leucine dehydrogenase|nr:Glu/Leu/Phe/Val dehydrogenase [Deltaproteobacteria bacterium]
MSDVWAEAQCNLARAAEIMKLEPELTERLMRPQSFTEFTVPLRLDDGRKKIFVAYRCRHQDAVGPTKDGTRIRPDLTPGEIKALALFMSVKHAVADIPAGGGKGGIEADPAALSEGEYERLIRGFMRRLTPKGAFRDVPGADLGTDARAMAWMLDEYEQISGFHAPAAVNDKPFELGGSRGGHEATGWGVAAAAGLAAAELGLKNPSAVVQGFGQVGSVAALTLAERGFRIVAVSDVHGAVADPAGLDVAALAAHVLKTGRVPGFPGGRPADPETILETDCQVLVPAAVQDVLTAANAGRVKAGLVVEAANAPVSPEADEIFERRGVTVVPDVVANCGGAVVCDFERTQGLSNDWWPLATVRERLEKRLVGAYAESRAAAREFGTSLRRGAWIKALRRIRAALLWRGWS